jgi:hypothetical protein
VLGCTTGSRGEVPEERKPVIRDDDGDDNCSSSSSSSSSNNNMILHIKTTTEISQEWANKPIHGKPYRDINNTNVDKNSSNKWLDRGELFRETKTYMVTIQDETIKST